MDIICSYFDGEEEEEELNVDVKSEELVEDIGGSGKSKARQSNR